MATQNTLAELIRHSRALAEQSRLLREQARESLSESWEIVDRTRFLITTCPISATPALALNRVMPEPLSAPALVSSEGALRLERMVDLALKNETLRLDGRHFVDCSIEDCVLQYSGGPVVMEGTNFSGCRFQFSGEAAMTISMMQCFGLMGEQRLVEQSTPTTKTESSLSSAPRPN